MRRLMAGLACGVVGWLGSAAGQTTGPVLDEIVARLYATLPQEALFALDEAAVWALITPEERAVLATGHVRFAVDAPAVVSVMRETRQPVAPWWLAESGFQRTELVVTNTEDWTYEVWQKRVEAGPVGLGINGFTRHGPHYFVAVGPADPGGRVAVSDLEPGQFGEGRMHPGAFVYHDWDSLLLKQVPEALRGHTLLRTIRGRSREAHFAGGFRRTAHPSGPAPDQVLLTWSADPATTQTVQWRTDTSVARGAARYRRAANPAEGWRVVDASMTRIEDRMLANDPVCHRFTAILHGLMPGTTYAYQVGDPAADRWSEEAEFTTAPAEPGPFTFIGFGDTHRKASWGRMLEGTLARHPETAFYMIAGDLVDTGQFRSDWDDFFHLSRNVFNRRPLLPAIGNHDEVEGLGSGMYRSLFALPANGPAALTPGHAYSVRYGNALVLVLHSGDPAMAQAAWIEEQLSTTDALWKIAVFHFPPYNYEEPYPEIRALWGYLFEKHGVDFTLAGHIHYYMRSHPMRADRPRDAAEGGVIHVVSIAIENPARDLPPEDYAAARLTGVPLYHTFEVDGRRLVFRALDADGAEHDRVELEK